ncbi:hypothetical protein QBC41DRAFT_304340 [Cercophora samala]|uniref:Uncharacterized protein n=1 Tax=Cercophora samala TaxID=330535 RepID=A0AA39ZAL7_9PEZI|nr:hypothetical protein QBC41DRAFT_304340 [Cercophora samala]
MAARYHSDWTPGPETCIPCLGAICMNDTTDLTLKFILQSRICSRQCPRLVQEFPESLSNAEQSCGSVECKNSSSSGDCERIPLIMRGNAYELQDLISFAVAAEKEITKGLFRTMMVHLNEIQKKLIAQIISMVTALISQFLLATRDVKPICEDTGNSAIVATMTYPALVRHRRQLNVASFPFPQFYGRVDEDEVMAWKSRVELRLLPEDPGFVRWHVAKLAFREGMLRLSDQVWSLIWDNENGRIWRDFTQFFTKDRLCKDYPFVMM